MTYATVASTNIYLLPATEGYVLVDTSDESKFAELEEAIKGQGVALSDIRFVVLTHHHPDHVGSLAQLRKENTFRIIAHRKTAEALEKGGASQPPPPHNWFGSVLLFIIKANAGGDLSIPVTHLTEEDIVFDDDGIDLREIAGVNARIVHTPGHSEDSVSVVFEDNTAIVGDLCVNMPPIFGSRYVPPFVHDLEKLCASWKKLLDMGVTRVFLGHGKPFESEKLAAFLKRKGRLGR